MNKNLLKRLCAVAVSSLLALGAAPAAQAYRGGGARGGHVSTGPRGGAAAVGPHGGAAAVGPRGSTAVRTPSGAGAAHGAYGGTAVRGRYGNTAVQGRYGNTAVHGRYGGTAYHANGYWGGRRYVAPGWSAARVGAYGRPFYGYPGWRPYGTYGLAPGLLAFSSLAFLSTGLLIGSYAQQSETIYVYVVNQDGVQKEIRVNSDGQVLSEKIVG